MPAAPPLLPTFPCGYGDARGTTMNRTFYAPGQPDVVYGVVTAVGAPPPLVAVPTVGAPGTW
eukprot:4513826-Heterocapsa_arctica.AAC.1